MILLLDVKEMPSPAPTADGMGAFSCEAVWGYGNAKCNVQNQQLSQNVGITETCSSIYGSSMPTSSFDNPWARLACSLEPLRGLL